MFRLSIWLPFVMKLVTGWRLWLSLAVTFWNILLMCSWPLRWILDENALCELLTSLMLDEVDFSSIMVPTLVVLAVD